MAVSEAYKILWGTSIVFVILPHLNLGLLSDYKICGDSACESLMGRVQAIRDYQGKDCRFLSFRQGDTIFVYHKLTGKREDLWAGSIDKQFGYFPKDAVQEEQVYANVEKVVETQESDFFCMDEFGYPIDSSHLDSDDDVDDDDNDQKIQNQESEITQTTLYTDDTNVESLQTSEDPSTESPVSTQEAEATLTEEDENKNTGDAAAGTHEEAQETPAAPNEQGGSAPSSWLGSSVTGWLGLAKEEETGNLAEGEKKDERKEAQAEGSVASSVTGWLGLGGDSTPVDAAESREQDGESADSFTSTMTGWLGFGGEKKMDDSVEKEQDEERENDEEPAETFRSRRMSLDLEGSQLHEEEKKEMGTLGWLGNGLSSTLGFGLTSQESGLETTTEIEAGEEEQPAPGSWLDMGIGGILGFGKDKSEVDESSGSGLKETEEDITLEQPTSSENMDNSQSQPALTEEITTNESRVEETPKDQDILSEIKVSADSDNNDISTSHSSNDSVLPEDAASKIDQKDITPQTKSEKTPQAVDGMSSMLNNSEEEEEDSVSDTGEESEEMEGKDYEMLKSIENESEDKNREPGEQETKTASDTDQGFFTQSDINLGPDVSSVDLAVNSMGGSVGDVGEDKTEEEIEEVAEIPNQISTTKESTDSSVKNVLSSHEGERNNAETDVLHREISTTQTDDSAEQSQVSRGGESQPFLSTGTAVERNEPIYSEDDSLPAHSVETNVDNSESLAMIDSNTDTETQQGELGQETELHPVEGSSQEYGSSHTDRGSEMMNENASEEDGRMFFTSESPTQMENNADQDSSPQVQQGATQSDGDEHELKETLKENEKDNEDKIQIQTEKETIETESEEVEKSKEGEKQGEREQIEEEEKLEELKDVEEINAQEKQQEVEGEKQKEVEGLKAERKQEEVEKKEQERVEELENEVVHELREKEKQEEADKIKEEDNQRELRELKEEESQEEGEELDEMSKNDEMEEVKGEKTQVEIEELKKEENQEVVEEWEENKEQEEVEEIKEEDNQEEVKELKGEGTQWEGEELNEKDKNDDIEEMKEEKKQEEEEELMKEENQEVLEEFEENKKQEEVDEIKEEESLEELKEEEKKHKEVEVLTEEEKLQIEELKEKESREELKEVGGVKDEEKKEGEEKQVQPHLEVEMENTLHSLTHTQKDIDSPESDSDEKDTQDEDSSESVFSELSTETERRQTENPQMEEREKGGETKTQERVEEVKDEEKQEMENVEDERRGKEGERSLKCSDELCPQASEDVFVRDRDGNDSANRLSSVDEEGIEAEKQNLMADDDQILADGTGVSQTVLSESMERDEDGIQGEKEKEEKRYDDKKENDLLYSGESGQNSLPDQVSVGQTAESKKDDQVNSSKADDTDLSDDNRLHQGATTEPENTKTSSNGISTDRKTEQIYSGHETDSEEDTDREETEINMKHADMQMMNQDQNTVGSEFRTKGGIDVPVLSSDPVISEQTVLSDGHNKEAAETGGGGAFGLFKNAFSFFSQSPVAETEGSTESAPSLDSNTGETSNAQTSLTPEQEPDSTTDPSQVYIQDSHTESPITVSQQQLQPSPPSTETQTSSLSPTQIHSHPTESPLQIKPNTKNYKNLLAYMSADETTILTELFGRHKLQFLDFILGSSESMTDDPDNDESILLDIERLLHYHRETLVAPSMKLSDTPQEDKEKTRTLIALQKLEMLLANVRETLSAAEASCVGGSCSTHSKDKEMAIEEDNNAPRDEWMGMDKEKDGELSGGTGNEKSGLEGVMKRILDFVLLIAEDSITHVHTVRELLIWLTVQVRVVG